MAFPLSPTNLQKATVDGINFVYWSNSNAWFRQLINSITLTVGNINVNNTATLGSSLTYTAANAPLLVGANVNSYVQIAVQNANGGNNASTDIAAVANNGSDNDTFINMGITGSTYSQSYLIVSGNSTTNGGNLIINTYSAKDIIFAVGGTLKTNEVARVRANTNSFVIGSSTTSTNVNTGALIVTGGMGISGNVNANVVYGNALYDSGSRVLTGNTAATTGKAIAMAMVFGG